MLPQLAPITELEIVQQALSRFKQVRIFQVSSIDSRIVYNIPTTSVKTEYICNSLLFWSAASFRYIVIPLQLIILE
jgi:hypothetical protein